MFSTTIIRIVKHVLPMMGQYYLYVLSYMVWNSVKMFNFSVIYIYNSADIKFSTHDARQVFCNLYIL